MAKNQRDTVHHLHGESEGGAFDVPADQLERVIARASVLQHAAGDSEQRRLSEGEIISIGKEVGLEPDHVRRALAEYRADSLAPPEPEEHPLLTRLLGPSHVRVRRVIKGHASEIHRQFEHRLRSEERMRPIRLRGTESLWEPDESWTGKLSRALDLEGRGYELSQLKSINIVAAPASTSEAMVTLTADLSEARKEQWQGWAMALFFISLFVLVPFFFSKAWLWLLLVPALLGAVGAACLFIHTSMNSKRRRAALLLEGLLDQLERR